MALLVALLFATPIVAQESAPIAYVIQPGDTLFSIARRYSVPVNDLATANSLLNPNLIYVGQTIQIPTASASSTPAAPAPAGTGLTYRIHVVQPGDNLFRIGLKYQVSVDAIMAANKLTNSALIFTGQELTIPIPTAANAPGAITNTIAQLPEPFVSFDIGPLPVAQGDIILVKVRTREAVTLQGSFLSWTIPFAQEGDTYYGVVGVSAHPTAGAQPGIYPLAVVATLANGGQVHVSARVQVIAGRFNSEFVDLKPEQQALLDPVKVQEEINKLNSVWSSFTPTRYWTGPFSLPIVNYVRISSPFGTRRSYNGGPFSSYHEGTDFSALSGTAVYAPANGVVVLAETLFVRGNAIVIDHGWGIYSGFYHLSAIEVTPGQQVKEGDQLGRVGTTGLSTGPHLHWDIRIRSLNVDPLQLTRQALP